MKQFVVITKQRSGSNFFLKSLSKHTNIDITECEPLAFKYLNNELKDIIYNNDFEKLCSNKNNIFGYKVMLNQLNKNKDFLKTLDKDSKIIFLKRNDIIKQYISNKYMKIYGGDIKCKELRINNYKFKPIEIDIKDLIEFYEHKEKDYIYFENYINKKNIDYIKIDSEDLFSKKTFNNTLNKVFNLLNLDSEKIPYSQIHPPNSESNKNTIINYNELKKQIKKNSDISCSMKETFLKYL